MASIATSRVCSQIHQKKMQSKKKTNDLQHSLHSPPPPYSPSPITPSTTGTSSNNPFRTPFDSLADSNPYKSRLSGHNTGTSTAVSRSTSVRSPRAERPHQHSHRRRRSYSSTRETHKENHSSHNAPRRSKRSSVTPDTIDRLGSVLDTPYHHDGPYDATLAQRQRTRYAPMEAVKHSNEAALRATPRANIIDSLERHIPLTGTAVYAPGMRLPGGEIQREYEEYDLMVKDGNYKRWDHVNYLDEDRKGKGEPSYTIEEAEKREKAARKAAKRASRSPEGLELQERGRRPRAASNGEGDYLAVPQEEGGLGRSNTTGRMEGLKAGLKKRLSLRRKRSS